MGRDVKVMKSTQKGEETFVNYIRAADGKRFDYKCTFPPSSDRVIWAAKIEGKWGRWRDTPDDEQVTYEIIGNTLSVTASMTGTNTYTQNDF